MAKTYFTYNEILYGKVCHDFGLASSASATRQNLAKQIIIFY
jgi:hypothetical protein